MPTPRNVEPINYSRIDTGIVGGPPILRVQLTCPHCGHEQTKPLTLMAESPVVLSCYGCYEYFTVQLQLYKKVQVTKLQKII